MANVRKVTKIGLDSLIAKGLLDMGTTYQIVDDNNRMVTAFSTTSVNETNVQAQYSYFTDPDTGMRFRTGVRDGKLVVDKELEVNGFSKENNEGWETLTVNE